jgi:hypothetical membrane protein
MEKIITMKTQNPSSKIDIKDELFRWLALGNVAGPIILTLAWIILGLIRPAIKTEWGISGGVIGMITQPVSGLGIGSNSTLFNTAFVLNGLLVIVGVFGVFQTIDMRKPGKFRTISILLLMLSGVGSILCGIFTLESFMFHMIGFILACGAPAFGFLTTGVYLRGNPDWKKFGDKLIYGFPITLVLLVIFFFTFRYDLMAAARGIAGLSERILVLEVQAWYVFLGILVFRQPYLKK